MRIKYFNISFLLALILFANSCKEKEYALPEAKTAFQNDCIKRTLGPNVVGLKLEFAYALALGKDKGKITSAQVEASFAGAKGTRIDTSSYNQISRLLEGKVKVNDGSSTDGTITKASFIRDTCAATLRYYYVIPEEARGKSVSFTFTAKASTGETVTYKMGPYEIAKQVMKLDLVANDSSKCYISIADTAIYTPTEAAAKPTSVDLVYVYRAITGINYNHALVSPTNVAYLEKAIVPAGATNTTKLVKVWQLRDQQLSRLQWGIFVDDEDLVQADFAGASDYAINLRAEHGVWAETADGKYKAYIYVNTVAAKTMKISMKRYTMK
jgi:hypothetical protein